MAASLLKLNTEGTTSKDDTLSRVYPVMHCLSQTSSPAYLERISSMEIKTMEVI